MPLDLSEVVNDPDLGQEVDIIRTTGNFGPGGWISNQPITIPAFGVLAVATDEALRQVPEGDRVEGAIQFLTATPIYPTSADQGQTSDQVQWNGQMYSVQSVGPWVDNGFYSAILLRISGE